MTTCYKQWRLVFSLTLFTGLTACTLLPFSITPKKAAISAEQNTLKHRLLLIETRSLLEQLMLIDKSDKKHTGDFLPHKKALNKKLVKKEKDLQHCSSYQIHNDITLALRCANMAYQSSPSTTNNDTLKTIQETIVKNLQKEYATQTIKKERERDVLKTLIKKQLLQTNHSATIKTLKQLLAIYPNDNETKLLLKKLQGIQQKHVSELITMGDGLYRNERIEQALEVWKAAKNLASNNQEVSLRINRAEKVLENINKIKALPKNKSLPN